MDYGHILTRAWQIAWRWKILWILGFLVALGEGGGSGNPFSYTLNDGNNASWGPWPGGGNLGDWGYWSFPPQDWAGAVLGIVGGLCCLGLLIGIAAWVLSLIARGGLIAAVRDVEDAGTTTLRDAWRAGVRRFWTLAGIWLLTLIPALLATVVVVVLIVFSVAGGVIGSEMSDPATIFGAVGPWLLCGLPLGCVLLLVSFVLGFVRVYAERAAVLDGLGWLDAFRYGWEVFKRNVGPTLVFWLVTLVVGLVVSVVALAAMGILAVPAIAIVSGSEGSAWTLIPIALGGLLAVIVLSVLGAIVQTFISVLWTLVYRALPHRARAAVPAE